MDESINTARSVDSDCNPSNSILFLNSPFHLAQYCDRILVLAQMSSRTNGKGDYNASSRMLCLGSFNYRLQENGHFETRKMEW